MKKTILFLAFCFAGLMSAASPSDNETVKVTVSEEMKIVSDERRASSKKENFIPWEEAKKQIRLKTKK